MSAFAQRLSRIQCTYSMLLKLRDSCNRLLWTDVPWKRELGVYVAPCRVTWMWRGTRTYSMAVQHQNFNLEHNKEATLLESTRENKFAHNLFLNSSKYAQTVMQPSRTHAYVTNEEVLQLLEQDWNLMTSQQILSAVKKLSYNIHYSSKLVDPCRYEDAMNALCANREQLSDQDLMTTIQYLVPLYWHLSECLFYQELCNKLDKECVKRFSQLHINQMLMVCDTLYLLNRRSNSEYIWYAVRKLGNKVNKLSPHHLVQLLFLLNVCRKPPVNMYELEYRLEQCLDDLTINELGVATLGFFKTRTPIRSAQMLGNIMRKTISEIEIADSVSIGGIAKLIRYSMKLTEINTLKALLDAVKPHEPRFTLMTLMHFAHACCRVTLYDKEFIERIAKRLNNELKGARLKEFERLIFIFASFNIDPTHSIYQNVIEELRTSWDTDRAEEIAKYPQVVSRIFGFLSYVNVYPTDLIQRIMTPMFVHNTCSGNYRYIPREYCVLDYSLRVDMPEYDGPFLKPEMRNFIAKKYFVESKNSESCRGNLLLMNVLQTCQEIFETTSDITVDRVLPHYPTSDIIFCLDERNRLMPSEKYLSEFPKEEIKRVDKEDTMDVRWIALVMASYGVLIQDTNKPVGLLAARIRQLSKIGYTPIMISQTSWGECRSRLERHDFIKNLIFKNNVSKITDT